MISLKTSLSLLLATSLIVTVSSSKTNQNKASWDPELARKSDRFSRTLLTADTSKLTSGDRQALDKIIEAAKWLDPLFRRQVWSGNEAFENKLLADHTVVGNQRVHYFHINDGPWSRLDNNEPFVEGVPHEKPPGANYYPEDMTREEFNLWLVTLPRAEQKKATGFFHLLRRGLDDKLMLVPYSEAYKDLLEPAAKLLREAAVLTTNASLRDFLNKRADAFFSNDYYASDIAWMDLDSPIDVTIGPYETWEDGLFGYKAAFEAYVTLRDDAETAKLARFTSYLQELENNLPIDPRYRNPKIGAASPIRVVNLVFSSGEGNSGVQTAAFNLPNDERVVREKGSKRVMLKNTQQAKFNKTLFPIKRLLLDDKDSSAVAFESFFTHILCHELMHGLGPRIISVNGQETTVRRELKELYSAIEEAKADITGLWALQYMIDRGIIDKRMERTLYPTYLASMFRGIRFGITEAHGRGVALQFNYLTDEGAIKFNPSTATFSIDRSKIKQSVRKLARTLLTIEAEGSYDKARAILIKFVVIRPHLREALEELRGYPVDLEPIFPLAK